MAELFETFSPYQFILLIVAVVGWIIQYNRLRWNMKDMEKHVESLEVKLKTQADKLDTFRDSVNGRLAEGVTAFAVIAEQLLTINQKLDRILNGK